MNCFICTLICSTPVEGRKRSRPGGLNKVCGVSPELQAIVGQATMPRTQVSDIVLNIFKGSSIKGNLVRSLFLATACLCSSIHAF